MNSDTANVIFGPPGTGKTTRLLETVSKYLSEGIDPSRICFLAFTRKAANEARERATRKFSLSYNDFPLFRTIHSLAFKQLGINRAEVMGIRDYISIAKSLGLFVTFRGIHEEGTICGLSKGDRLLFMESMARARMTGLEEYWEQFPDEDILLAELQQLADTVASYKESSGKIDFIDMLYRFLVQGHVPEHDKLIVDEAQDLSPLQWRVVDKIARESQEVTVAGDDDQAIFTWAGADVDEFINLPGRRIVLTKSHRVPAEIQNVASGITARIEVRVSKGWEPRDAAGAVEHINDLSQIDMSYGTWLLLARNMFLLEQFNKHCLTAGYVFTSSLGSPVQDGSLRAIITWENLRKGKTQSVSDITSVYELMTSNVGVRHGFKKVLESHPENAELSIEDLKEKFGLMTQEIWHVALDKIPELEREYFISALRRGEKLLKEPRIRISTIHSVKGGEADYVVLCTDMAQRTYSEFFSNPDAEHRVWYVAVTRAREKLYIMTPTTNAHYKL